MHLTQWLGIPILFEWVCLENANLHSAKNTLLSCLGTVKFVKSVPVEMKARTPRMRRVGRAEVGQIRGQDSTARRQRINIACSFPLMKRISWLDRRLQFRWHQP